MPLFRRLRAAAPCIALAAALVLNACQLQAVSPVQLEIRQSLVDHDGLTAPRVDPDVQVTCAPPTEWDMLPLRKTMLYTHQQWRSPDRQVGMGVAHLRTPIPLSAQLIVWLARQQYPSIDSRHSRGGHLISQWTDTLGRAWFEAENDMYHVTGCAMTHGFDAWIVYSGYRLHGHPAPDEIVLSARAANTVVPLLSNNH
jgi:hypothetical protein